MAKDITARYAPKRRAARPPEQVQDKEKSGLSVVILGELYSSKNGRKLRRGRRGFYTVKSDLAASADAGILLQLNAQRKTWERMTAGRSFPLHVCFSIFRRTNGIFDYINITQSLQDMMTKAGYIPDDNARFLLPVFDEFQIDPSNPRTILTII